MSKYKVLSKYPLDNNQIYFIRENHDNMILLTIEEYNDKYKDGLSTHPYEYEVDADFISFKIK